MRLNAVDLLLLVLLLYAQSDAYRQIVQWIVWLVAAAVMFVCAHVVYMLVVVVACFVVVVGYVLVACYFCYLGCASLFLLFVVLVEMDAPCHRVVLRSQQKCLLFAVVLFVLLCLVF